MSDINYYASIAKVPSVKFLKNAYDVTLAPDAASTFSAARSFFLPNNVAANTYLLGSSGAALTAAKLPKTATNGLIEASGIGIDSSNNLTSVGTISSGKITSSTADMVLGSYTVTAVATGNLLTSATAVAAFATSVTTPAIYGGADAGSDLTLAATSHASPSGANILFGAAGALGSIAETGIWTFPVSVKLASSGATASALNFYAESSQDLTFAPNGSGSSNTGTETLYITRIGRLVTLKFTYQSDGTAAGTTTGLISTTNLPTWARPSVRAICSTTVKNAGVLETGLLIVGTDGSITGYRQAFANFGSGACYVYDTCITYNV
jgi:hypothetical protein